LRCLLKYWLEFIDPVYFTMINYQVELVLLHNRDTYRNLSLRMNQWWCRTHSRSESLWWRGWLSPCNDWRFSSKLHYHKHWYRAVVLRYLRIDVLNI
jgi:hypothetical protein